MLCALFRLVQVLFFLLAIAFFVLVDSYSAKVFSRFVVCVADNAIVFSFSGFSITPGF